MLRTLIAMRATAAPATRRGRTGWARCSGSEPCRLVRRSAGRWQSQHIVSRTRCSASSALLRRAGTHAEGSFMNPGSAAHHGASHSASKTRVNALARTLVHALKYQDRTDLAPARWYRYRCTGGAAGAAATNVQVMPFFIGFLVGSNRFFHSSLDII